MDKEFKAGVLTISTKGSLGQRKDESGQAAVRLLENEGFYIAKTRSSPTTSGRSLIPLLNGPIMKGFPLL